MDGYVGVDEFARLSGFSKSTIHRRIADGSLPIFQPGGPGTRLTIPLTALGEVTAKRETADVTAVNDSAAVPEVGAPARLPGRTPAWRSISKTGGE